MRLLIPNRHLASIATLLEGMVLKPAQSRTRSKLLDLIEAAQLRFGKDEYDLVTTHATLDGEGKPIIGEDGTFHLAQGTDTREFLRLRDELLDSLAEVEGPTYATHLTDIARVLAEYDEPLSGQAAAAYSVLFDAVEAAHAAEPNAKESSDE